VLVRLTSALTPSVSQIPGGGGFKMFGKDDIEKMTREMKTEEPEEEL